MKLEIEILFSGIQNYIFCTAKLWLFANDFDIIIVDFIMNGINYSNHYIKNDMRRIRFWMQI